MSKYNFVHLHNHTEYSILDGMLSIKKLVEKAKKLNMNAIAITDHGNMYGVIEFFNECKKNDIKAIIGSEFYISQTGRLNKSVQKDNNHIILLAKDNIGYKNLLKLSSLSYTEGFYYHPRIDKELLEKYNDGLICLSACIVGEIPSLIIQDRIEEAEKVAKYYQDLFGKTNFFLELQYHGLRDEQKAVKGLISISKKLQIPLVATNDSHYLNKDDAEAHDIMLCIGTKKRLNDPKRLKFYSNEFYFKTEEEMIEIFKEIPKVLMNSQTIAEMCELKLNLPGPILPEFEVPENFTKESYLKEIAYEGLKKRYDNVTKDLINRIDNEIEIINKMGFAGYFLIVWDFIKYAKEKNIWVGPGRGSGAGSLVAYSLQITNIDPIKYDLLFERFLHDKRKTMPDFDIDFCQERRNEVINYVTEKYGQEKVSQIVTFSKMKPKAVVRDVGRVLDIPLKRINYIAKLIPQFPEKILPKELSKNYNLFTIVNYVKELKDIYENGTEEEKKLFDISAKIEGMTRHTSVHAAGVVIGKEKITEYVPLQIVKDKKKGEIVTTQFPGPQLEDCGLVKMDFLGLITLTVIRDCVNLLKEKNIFIDLDKIDFNDQKVFDIFGRGDTDTIFQFESDGMKKYLTKLKPTCLEDLIAMNALYRPGPMQFIDTYIARKHKKEKIEYDHPLLESVLKETYGIMIYQEQVMKIAQVLAGYDLGTADMLRRAMGKKKKDEMAKNKRIFIYGNKEDREEIIKENINLKKEGKKLKDVPPEIPGAINNGISEELAEKIFDKMEKFADYGFNKSHAAAYAYLAYQTAYLKAYYPVEFMASVLNSEIGKPDKLLKYIYSLKDLKIEIIPPDINKSFVKFSVIENKINYALTGIKGVGDIAAENIVNAREKEGKFCDIYHFLQSVDLRVVNRAVLEILIKCGAMDSLGHKRKWMLENLDEAIKESQIKQNDKKIGQNSLFEDILDNNFNKSNCIQEEWKENEKLSYEKEILGFYSSIHPLYKYSSYIKNNCNYNSKTIKKIVIDGENKYSTKINVIIAGIIDKVEIIRSEKGYNWAKLNMEDMEGFFTVKVFNNTFDIYKDLLINNNKILIKGYVKMGNSDKKDLIAESIFSLDEIQQKSLSEFHIFIKDKEIENDSLSSLKYQLMTLQGSLSLYFHIKNDEGKDIVIYSNEIKAPKDLELVEMFKEKYDFIDKIILK